MILAFSLEAELSQVVLVEVLIAFLLVFLLDIDPFVHTVIEHLLIDLDDIASFIVHLLIFCRYFGGGCFLRLIRVFLETSLVQDCSFTILPNLARRLAFAFGCHRLKCTVS